MQFLAETIAPALSGEIARIAAGRSRPRSTPPEWLGGRRTVGGVGRGFAVALVMGVLAGLLLALRAARLSPREALRTV
jgi:putative ABC transport system permease protein